MVVLVLVTLLAWVLMTLDIMQFTMSLMSHWLNPLFHVNKWEVDPLTQLARNDRHPPSLPTTLKATPSPLQSI